MIPVPKERIIERMVKRIIERPEILEELKDRLENDSPEEWESMDDVDYSSR